MSARYRIIVDTGLCQGHSVCVAVAPEIFRTVDAGGPYLMVEAIIDRPAPELLEKARTAEELCPNGVIRIVPDDAPASRSTPPTPV